ncbi:MAG: hypothetical protein RL320_207 [Pseudomonadota bacterium]|jgi:hypothetical protein
MNLARRFTLGAALCVTLSSFSAAMASAPVVKAPQVDNPMRVLLVGNSYLYYNDSLHNYLRRMVAATDPASEKKLEYKSATIGGASLSHHNIDWLTKPGQIGVKEPFQLVVLQGHSAAALSEARRKSYSETAKSFAEVIRSRGGQVALYMTHAYVAPHKQAKAESIREIERFYVETGNALNALVIPVGLAFEEAYKRRPDLKLHKDYDGSHPELAGTYLAAAVSYASIYGKSPIGNTFDAFGKIDPELMKFLQTVAWETVQAFQKRN